MFCNTQRDAVSLRGTDDAVVRITNNTIACCGDNLIRVSGNKGMVKPQIINMNALIQPRMAKPSTIDNRAYIYIENNASVTEGTGAQANVKVKTVEEAKVDVKTWYQPLSGSVLGDKGYRKK